MNRRRRYLGGKLRGAPLWVVSVACMGAALAVAPVVRWVDERTRWTMLGFGAEGARTVVGALSASLLTFIVFSFSTLLLLAQIAGAQLTPRVIARPFESRLTKLALGIFVFAFTYSLAALGRIEDVVPQLSVLLAVVASLISIVAFLYLIQDVGAGLRPGIVLTTVADATSLAIDIHYPNPISQAARESESLASEPMEEGGVLPYRGRSGVVAAFDVAGLVEIATRANCSIELVPEIGDFIAVGDTLFRFRGRESLATETQELHRYVRVGPEQSVEEDPLFGFRIIADIAAKALSPAINDPGTAVEALGRLHHLLNLVGHRQLDSGIVRDGSGQVRLTYWAPQWEDFVALSVAEVRACASESPQLRRRFHTVLAGLVRTLPEPRAAVLRQEMEGEDAATVHGAPNAANGGLRMGEAEVVLAARDVDRADRDAAP